MRLVADWWSHARSDLAGSVMIALRRRDVAELNALARGLMETNGRLGHERVMVAGREFASGDRIVSLRNSDRLGVKNGTRGTVERVDNASGTLKYTVFRDNLAVATVTGWSATLPAVAGTSTYAVRALDKAGNTSATTVPVTVTVP